MGGGATLYTKYIAEYLDFNVSVSITGHTTSEVKRYDSANFVPVKNAKFKTYSGSFVQKPLKRYDSGWEDST